MDYYDNIEDAKFVYNLSKDKEDGRFDFNTLEWGEPVYIVVKYRLNKDLRYFVEYTKYCLEDFIEGQPDYGIFEEPNYTVQREIYEWEILKVAEFPFEE